MNAVCVCSFPSIMLIFHEKLLEGVLHRKDPHSYLCFAFLGDRFYFSFIVIVPIDAKIAVSIAQIIMASRSFFIQDN